MPAFFSKMAENEKTGKWDFAGFEKILVAGVFSKKGGKLKIPKFKKFFSPNEKLGRRRFFKKRRQTKNSKI
jgi:hypothetical protein